MNGGCMHLDRIHDATPLVLGLRGLPERHASTLDRVVTAMAESFGGDPVGVAVFDKQAGRTGALTEGTRASTR